MTTEEKIKEAARQVFIAKGFEATRTRDIAEAAGINIASLHYYFRSKDKLFDIVMGEALKGFNGMIDSILGSDDPLHVKVRRFVETHVDFFIENPYVPMFILSESQRNPEHAASMLHDKGTLEHLKKELTGLAEQGVIRKVHPIHFFMNLVSMTVFPFVGREVIKQKMTMSDKEYLQIMEERKQVVPDAIISYLYLEKPS